MLAWLGFIAGTGAYNVAQHPSALRAWSPAQLGRFWNTGNYRGAAAWRSLGGVVLCLTGSEALYADMGHFGTAPRPTLQPCGSAASRPLVALSRARGVRVCALAPQAAARSPPPGSSPCSPRWCCNTPASPRFCCATSRFCSRTPPTVPCAQLLGRWAHRAPTQAQAPPAARAMSQRRRGRSRSAAATRKPSYQPDTPGFFALRTWSRMASGTRCRARARTTPCSWWPRSPPSSGARASSRARAPRLRSSTPARASEATRALPLARRRVYALLASCGHGALPRYRGACHVAVQRARSPRATALRRRACRCDTRPTSTKGRCSVQASIG